MAKYQLSDQDRHPNAVSLERDEQKHKRTQLRYRVYIVILKCNCSSVIIHQKPLYPQLTKLQKVSIPPEESTGQDTIRLGICQISSLCFRHVDYIDSSDWNKWTHATGLIFHISEAVSCGSPCLVSSDWVLHRVHLPLQLSFFLGDQDRADHAL